jgi:hypothetical protein
VYTHTLKADYPIAINFIQGSTAPEINISTSGNLILEGDVNSPEHGVINFTSLTGSIVSAERVAIYGAIPNLQAGPDADDVIRLRIEGNKVASDAKVFREQLDEKVLLRRGDLVEHKDGPLYRFTGNGKVVVDVGIGEVSRAGVELVLDEQDFSDQRNWLELSDRELNAKAGGDIALTAISVTNNASRFKIGSVMSAHGNVYLDAPDGIYAAAEGSQVKGELVELRAASGAIGSQQLVIKVDSDIDGVTSTGGLVARASAHFA